MLRKIIFYGIVGASGVAVNIVVLTVARWLLPHFPTLTYLIAVEASIVTNFLLNARLTFRQPPSWRGMGEYNVVTAFGAIVQTAIYRYLLGRGWHYIWADLLAIPFATAIGFVLSLLWVFRRREEATEHADVDPPRAPRPQRSGSDR
jgi:putative flippase GtrA